MRGNDPDDKNVVYPRNAPFISLILMSAPYSFSRKDAIAFARTEKLHVPQNCIMMSVILMLLRITTTRSAVGFQSVIG